MKLATTILVTILCLTPGCGLGQKANTEFGFSKMTGRFYCSDSKDNDIKIGEISGNGSSTSQPASFHAKDIAITNNASNVNPTIAALVDANTRMYKQWGDNTVGAINAVTAGIAQDVAAFTPLGTSWIAGHTQVKMAEAQYSLIPQLVQLVTSGQRSVNDIKAIDPAIGAQVEAKVAAIAAKQ